MQQGRSISEKVLECAFEVSNSLGVGFLESVYENAMCVELQQHGLKFKQQRPLKVIYKGSVVGNFITDIIVENKPLIDVVSTLAGDIDISQNTIDVATGDGANFPSSGKVIIGSEVVSYTGITTDQFTGVTRGVLGTTAATHSEDDAVHSTILFLSNTPEGTAVTYTVQSWDTEMHATSDGLLYSFNQAVFQVGQYSDRLSKQDVANRVKIIYYYGYNTIPEDITRLALLLGKRQLMQDSIGKAIIAGRDEFKPRMFNADKDEIESIISSYIVLSMGNT